MVDNAHFAAAIPLRDANREAAGEGGGDGPRFLFVGAVRAEKGPGGAGGRVRGVPAGAGRSIGRRGDADAGRLRAGGVGGAEAAAAGVPGVRVEPFRQYDELPADVRRRGRPRAAQRAIGAVGPGGERGAGRRPAGARRRRLRLRGGSDRTGPGRTRRGRTGHGRTGRRRLHVRSARPWGVDGGAGTLRRAAGGASAGDGATGGGDRRGLDAPPASPPRPAPPRRSPWRRRARSGRSIGSRSRCWTPGEAADRLFRNPGPARARGDMRLACQPAHRRDACGHESRPGFRSRFPPGRPAPVRSHRRGGGGTTGAARRGRSIRPGVPPPDSPAPAR